ncbi:chaplin [Streptomyces sp. NPDC046727]|uniref:chaplin n=1 Tax=Streptomyces sp. NPDC046727 TaxID=3155373 RepID=UPI0033F43474
MRLRSITTTTVLTGVLALTGAASAFAADPAPAVAVAVPGVVSGNVIEVPIGILSHVCGNNINVVGVLNVTLGNTCVS